MFVLLVLGMPIHYATTLVAEKLNAAPSQVFVRSEKEVTVEHSLKKKEKHQEKMARREERKLAKKSFIGFTQQDVSFKVLRCLFWSFTHLFNKY